MDKTQLEAKANKVQWIWARTYADIAPHWYIREREQPDMFNTLQKAIKEYGVNEWYTNYKKNKYICRYLYLDEHKYWRMGSILNRALIHKGE